MTLSNPSNASAARDRALGFGLAVLCSIGLGLAVALSRLAYEGGANALTVSMARGWFGVSLLVVVCLITGRSMAVPRRRWPEILFLGLLMAHMNYGNIASVAYIPVGLAALLFFFYPPLVSVFTAVLDRRMPTPLRGLAVIGAFVGLMVMLGVGEGPLNPIGVFLGLSAALACATNFTYVARKMMDYDALVLVLHMTLVAAITLTIVTFSTGQFSPPTVEFGWLGAAGVVICQASSIPLYFLALHKIGPERASVTNNLQPVASIVAAWMLFGEILTPERVVGACMVLGGILLMQWDDARRRGRIG